MELEKKIRLSLEKIRPSLQADGGDLEFVSFNSKSGVLEIKFKGMC
ncbi:MAG: NifU family protein, partial [bacterium]